MKTIKNIAIFASGGGSNAEVILNYFKKSSLAKVVLIVSDQKDAGVLKRAEAHEVPFYIHSSEDLKNGKLLEVLEKYDADILVLAGYLRLIPKDLVESYKNKIVNIHPALLPKFGGKGMYGMNVHRAVLAAGEKESGPTIHFVNEQYDEGDIIAQFKCRVLPDDSPEDLQKRVLELEHANYAPCIENLISER